MDNFNWTFDDWHEEVLTLWRKEKLVRRSHRYNSREYRDYLRLLFAEHNTPTQALVKYKQLDAESYADEYSAREYHITKTKLELLMPWISSRHNAFNKQQAIHVAYKTLAHGQEIIIFSCGSLDAIQSEQYHAYLVNGPKHYIARGVGIEPSSFKERSRYTFHKQYKYLSPEERAKL